MRRLQLKLSSVRKQYKWFHALCHTFEPSRARRTILCRFSLAAKHVWSLLSSSESLLLPSFCAKRLLLPSKLLIEKSWGNFLLSFYYFFEEPIDWWFKVSWCDTVTLNFFFCLTRFVLIFVTNQQGLIKYQCESTANVLRCEYLSLQQVILMNLWRRARGLLLSH